VLLSTEICFGQRLAYPAGGYRFQQKLFIFTPIARFTNHGGVDRNVPDLFIMFSTTISELSNI
jgi:hypothetical protein